ncbi:MAG TPA: MdtA/MuxA family multidrug efflux RND transporter periplasmic adaptor subunit [Burkholderiales bacterium]|nr:MdtA/MuxA family multidrug efflux RND transporter periplasmic adaptor subunit [Burkholderiales bacterium]
MNKMTTPELEDNRPATRAIADDKPTPLLRRWWLWLLLIGIVAGGYFLFGRTDQTSQASAGRPSGGGRDRATPVTGVPAKTADVNIYLNGLGAVTPLNTVTVRARVEGQLMRILFREGDTVKAGDLLAEIDPRPYQVQLAQVEGQLARDQALLKNAQLDLERYRMLFEQDSIAKQEVDTQAALVRQYEGAVKASAGQVDNAKLQLSYARITAPIGGRLGLRQVDPGNMVRSGDTNGIVVITQLDPVTVIFPVPEDNLPAVMKKLRAGEKLPVDAFDRDGKKKLASGSLLTADNQIDPTTGTVKLKAEFPNNDYSLFPNQFVNARMLVDVRRGVTVVPSAAVQRGARGTFVYVVNADKKVAIRSVQVGPSQDDNAAIETGLSPGEMVVVDGVDRLKDGATVELVTKGAEPAKDAAPRKPRGERKRREQQ